MEDTSVLAWQNKLNEVRTVKFCQCLACVDANRHTEDENVSATDTFPQMWDAVWSNQKSFHYQTCQSSFCKTVAEHISADALYLVLPQEKGSGRQKNRQYTTCAHLNFLYLYFTYFNFSFESIAVSFLSTFVMFVGVSTGGEFKGRLSIAVNFNRAGERQKTSKTVWWMSALGFASLAYCLYIQSA